MTTFAEALPNPLVVVGRSRVVGVRTGAEDFADAVRPHLGLLSNLVARTAPDLDRDDVVQDVLVRAWQKRSSFDESRGSMRTWLCAIAYDQVRRRRTRRRPEILLPAPDATLEDRAGRMDLDRAISRLPDKQRLAVDLVYVVGLTVEEAAGVLGVATGTVKSNLSDARARLRAALEVQA